ncbi:MAG: hypothetical protein H6581_15790 [Bacteroidia bacterium]|nr:hypothetical protein [Bacteroidia bacterium]
MSALNPQTPGVYTVEKSSFPPAVGQVPTAIPAFIGYTEKAEKDGKSLTNTPVLIQSLSDYNELFGGAPAYEFPINQVPKPSAGPPAPDSYDFTIGAGFYKVGPAETNKYYMYNSLRMFYLNGGGPAYIVSVGSYIREKGTTLILLPERADLLNGLDLLPTIQFPKPTMILIPDGLALSKDDNTVLQQQMISQAGELIDRVAMLDVYDGYKGLDTDVISEFRNGVGVTFLSYAIAYYPWLQCSVVTSSEINFSNIFDPPAAVPNGAQKIADLVKGNPLIPKLQMLNGDLKTIRQHINSPTVTMKVGTADQDIPFPNWKSAYQGSAANTTVALVNDQTTVLAAMYDTIFKLANGQKVKDDGIEYTVNSKDFQNALNLLVNPNGTLATTMKIIKGVENVFGISNGKAGAGLATWKITGDIPVLIENPEAAKYDAYYGQMSTILNKCFGQLLKAIGAVTQTIETLVDQTNTALVASSKDYSNIMKAIAKQANILPPTGAMAGIYTLMDNTRGVWKAPANINIDAVVEPCVVINDSGQEGLNVDALAGKSINAIRSFFGRGPAIVWGARTLDGNSLDYRYVPVRRTLIMIEESVKNAAFSMVFEPNDANTWVSVDGMITNFLSGLWAQGALQGATPKDAFSVEVGLGKTMSALDILNGIMRVSVKLAIVRPAEFIIITYEQQMAKSG